MNLIRKSLVSHVICQHDVRSDLRTLIFDGMTLRFSTPIRFLKSPVKDTRKGQEEETYISYIPRSIEMANPYKTQHPKPLGLALRALQKIWSGVKRGVSSAFCGALGGKGLGVAAKILVFLFCCGLFFLQFGDIFTLYRSQVRFMVVPNPNMCVVENRS